MRKKRLLILEIATPILIILLWGILSQNSSQIFFPPLSEVLKNLWSSWILERTFTDIVPSLVNLGLGFLIAAVLGVFLGVCIGLIKPVSWAIDPILHFVRAVPPVALIPVFIVLFGFSSQMNVIAIVVASIFPTILTTVDGIRSVNAGLRDFCTSYRLSWSYRLRYVYLPAASPQIFAGLLVSLQVAFLVMVASEMLGSTHGIGAQTILAQQTFMAVEMWSGIILLGVLGYLINIPFTMLRKRVLAWNEGARKVALAE